MIHMRKFNEVPRPLIRHHWNMNLPEKDLAKVTDFRYEFMADQKT